MTTVGMLGAFGRRPLRVTPTLAITGQVCVGDDLFQNQREFFTGHCLEHMPIFRRQGDHHSFMDYYLALVCQTSARSRAFFFPFILKMGPAPPERLRPFGRLPYFSVLGHLPTHSVSWEL